VIVNVTKWDEKLPDLVVDRAALLNSVQIATETFSDLSCAVAEGCVSSGAHELLRFATGTINNGFVLLENPDRHERPDLYNYGLCHGHWHSSGYASHELFNMNGKLVSKGGKLGYCLADSRRATAEGNIGPWISCEPSRTCDNQGLQAGWSDIYPADIDCQWLVIDDLPDGWYKLRIGINVQRVIHEQTFENNFAEVWVNINGDEVIVSETRPNI